MYVLNFLNICLFFNMVFIVFTINKTAKIAYIEGFNLIVILCERKKNIYYNFFVSCICYLANVS